MTLSVLAAYSIDDGKINEYTAVCGMRTCVGN
jgi:hypothetical protein